MAKPIVRILQTHILKIEKNLILKRDLALLENHIVSEIPDGVSFVEVSSQNIEDVREFRGESVLQKFHEFYANGCHGAYAYLEGVVIGHQWMEINNTKVYRLSKEGILLLPGEGATWYANVDEKYRGKRVIYGLRNKVYEKAKSLGYRTLRIHILHDNEASIRSHRRLGGIVSETRATILRALCGLIVIYKSCDRWFVLLTLPGLGKGIGVAWSEPYRFGLLLVKR